MIDLIFQILPSLVRVVHDLWANRVCSPESDQQVVKVLPFLMIRPIDHFSEGEGTQLDGDPLKFFRSNGLERHGDPPHARPSPPKHQILEFCGLGEVKERLPKRVYVHER